jgi:hypothetical protein
MYKTVQKDIKAEFAYEEVFRLAGGEDNYSVHTKSAIWAECYRNEEIKTLAGMYLVGSSDRAERNLSRLRAKLYEVFLKGVSE